MADPLTELLEIAEGVLRRKPEDEWEEGYRDAYGEVADSIRLALRAVGDPGEGRP